MGLPRLLLTLGGVRGGVDAVSVRVPVRLRRGLVRDFLFVTVIIDNDNSVSARDGVHGPGYAGEEVLALSTVVVVVASLCLAER